MLKLDDFIKDLKAELKATENRNQTLLNIVGFEVSEKVKELIGTKQSFWQDLAESTVEEKQRKGWGRGGDPAGPLWASGAFHDDVQYRVQGNKVDIFTDKEYIMYTEYGTSKMPPRPVFKPAALIALKELMKTDKIQKTYLRSLR